ncbi:class I SAM-dependent methyltransferase [Gammaproteobacteria bacterium]|nr:class I SAM-dependent methyltransferase [Gammaproteobacteria bacterium]
MKFDKNYTQYWSAAVNKSVDGTIIAGENEAKTMLKYLNLKREDLVLDLGCSFGRMYEALSKYSDKVFGVDVDAYAVQKAKSQSYIDVRVGSGENTNFEDASFNAIFCWAVFELVNHKKGFIEFNRILKNNGKLLLTGKNNNYYKDDMLAFKAEKNASLKNYPNRFSDLKVIVKNIKVLGFKIDKIILFPNRGDMGLLKFIDEGNVPKDKYIGYEYLIICHKISEPKLNKFNDLKLENPTSNTSIELAKSAGFDSVKEFFLSIGID